MAGTLNNTTSSGCDGPCVFAANNNGNMNGTSSGAEFIFTDTNYPGLSTQLAAFSVQGQLTNLVQGDVEIKNVTANLNGLAPPVNTTLSPYQNFLFWQDRRNSTDTCTTNNATATCSPSTAAQLAANHVTNTSPRVLMGPGNAGMNLKGVFYQPRGAWFELDAGGASTGTALTLQLITGALTCSGVGGNGCGSATVVLAAPSAPVIEFITALIQ